MKFKIFSFIFLLLSYLKLSASPAADSVTDTEQKYLELNYVYENLLGIRLDTMQNLNLYNEIYAWLGTPYRYSGESKDGIDCSGFVNCICIKVFEQPLASSSSDIFNRNIIPLKLSELKEGDLVFFKIRRKSVSHVGVYLGQNLFAHASRKSGVIISSLEETYYAKYFYKGGRLKN